MAELASMSDEELLKALEEADYFKNNVRYRAVEDFVVRDIAGEVVLVPVGEATSRLNGFVTFSETGQFLWKLLSEKEYTKADLAWELGREYSCSQEKLLRDVESCLKDMLANGVIERR